MAEGSLITVEDLDLLTNAADIPEALNLRQIRDEAERKAVQRALLQTSHNISQAADLLGITRPTLYDLMNKFGLK